MSKPNEVVQTPIKIITSVDTSDEEIAELLLALSALYEFVGGDELIIVEQPIN